MIDISKLDQTIETALEEDLVIACDKLLTYLYGTTYSDLEDKIYKLEDENESLSNVIEQYEEEGRGLSMVHLDSLSGGTDF